MARRHIRARNFHGNRDDGGRRDMFMCPRCGRLVKAWRWCCDECWARMDETPPRGLGSDGGSRGPIAQRTRYRASTE